MLSNRPFLPLAAGLALAALAPGAQPAQAQVYSTQQATPQASSQSYSPMSCYCPFPQGYCPFPQGYCGLPACGLSSPQGSAPTGQMTTPAFSYQGYSAKPYPAPTPYTPRPLGIPTNSMPSSQGEAWPDSQVAIRKK